MPFIFGIADIQNDRVGLMLLAQSQRLEAVRRFGDHLESGLRFDQAAKTAPDDARDRQPAERARRGLQGQRQPDGERRSLARRAVQGDGAAQLAHALLDATQPKACSTAAGIQSDAVVAHGHFDGIAAAHGPRR